MLVDLSLEDIDFIQKLIETKEENLLSKSEIELEHRLYDKLSQKSKTLAEIGYKGSDGIYEKHIFGDLLLDGEDDIIIKPEYKTITIARKRIAKDGNWTDACVKIHFDELIAIANKASELFKEE